MENKKHTHNSHKKTTENIDTTPLTQASDASSENKKKDEHEEEHFHGNYMFAFKILCILLAIIVVIIILKASGVPIAIKDWFAKSADMISCFPKFF